jgi:hypothetical protein
MEAKLLVTSGNTNKRWVALRLPTVLGRGREAGLTVPHPLVSRRHCELFEHDGLLMVRDLKSLNGTMVGGRRISLAPLPPGAEFTVGPLTFQADYEYAGDPAAVPAAQFVDEPRPQAQHTVEAPPAPAPEDDMPEFFMMDAPAAAAEPAVADSPAAAPAAASTSPRRLDDSAGADDFFEAIEGLEVSPAQPRPKAPQQPAVKEAEKEPAPAAKSSPWRGAAAEAAPADEAPLPEAVPVAEAVAPAAALSEAEWVPVDVVSEMPEGEPPAVAGGAEAAEPSQEAPARKPSAPPPAAEKKAPPRRPAGGEQPKPKQADEDADFGDFLAGLK